MDNHPHHVWNCPRCGSTFEPGQRPRLSMQRDERPPRERFIHHAQRDHDLDEQEALALVGCQRR